MNREARLLFSGLFIGTLACSDDAPTTGTPPPADAAAEATTDAGPPDDADAPAIDASDEGAHDAAIADASPTQTDADSASIEACLMAECMPELTACMGDEACSGWMDCIQECGEDKMKCPTFCGLYYPTPLANDFITCALDHACMSIDFSSYPPCAVPGGSFEDLSGMDGTWWFAMHHGEPYLFDYDCQKLTFDEVSATDLEVAYSVPLTRNDETRVCTTQGTFHQRDDGSVLIVYDTFVGYHEDWYIVHKTEDVIVAHVCFASDGETKNYGTLVVTREPLDELEATERDALNEAIEQRLGLDPAEFEHASRLDCLNE